MATMQLMRRPRTLRVVLVAMIAAVAGVLLVWSITPADVHAADAPATPGNEMLDDHPVLSLVADDGDRRGDGAPVLVAHSVADVARRYDASPDDAVVPMLDALRRLLGLRSGPLWTHAHRWRFAAPAQNRDDTFHLGDDGIGLAGDGWGRARIETAWRSGTDLARAVVERSRQS